MGVRLGLWPRFSEWLPHLQSAIELQGTSLAPLDTIPINTDQEQIRKSKKMNVQLHIW